MNIKQKQRISLSFFGNYFTSAAFALTVLISFLIAIPAATAGAQSGKTADSYCNKYTVTSEKYSCRDGWKGVDCTDYLITHDQSHVDICQGSARQAAAVGSGGDSPESLGDTPTSNNSNNSEGLDTIMDMLSQIDKTQREFGQGKDKDVDDIPDNNYGAYINGKGEKQPIRITKASGKGRPAIIFFNGGGWHQDDRTGDKVAPLAQKRGYTTFVATYRLGSSGIYYQYEDVMRAIRHVRNNAAMYGIDPTKIAVWGDSAGASLALRASSSGKSGASAAVGWSAPTNAYTAIFKSPQAFAIGMDHSTCVPTDANGVINMIDQMNGGPGNVVENDGGLGNNNFDSFVDKDGIGMVTDVLTLAQRAQGSGLAAGSMASGLASDAESQAGQSSNQLTAKKFIQCLDNFNAASPALFASPLSPPTFLAGFNSDVLVDPGQLYQMRDKLRGMGVPSSVLTLPGDPTPVTIQGKNHLDYNEAFVNPTLDFLDKHMPVKKEK